VTCLAIVGWCRQVHDGMRVYAGAPASARRYVEAVPGRADDYYLVEALASRAALRPSAVELRSWRR
jgi:hypothetical protein